MVTLAIGGGDPRLFDNMLVRHEEGLNGSSRLFRPALAVPLEDRLYPASKATHGFLYPVPLRCSYLINKVTGV